MATKSTSHKETLWSFVAVGVAIVSLTYCIQHFFGQSPVDITTVLAKLKLLRGE